jgi:hypothetical protein
MVKNVPGAHRFENNSTCRSGASKRYCNTSAATIKQLNVASALDPLEEVATWTPKTLSSGYKATTHSNNSSIKLLNTSSLEFRDLFLLHLLLLST